MGEDEEILLVYATDNPSGQIMVVSSITRLGPSISTHSWVFIAEDSTKESDRWKGVVEKFESYGFVEAANHKRQMFIVTNQGYKAAETAKDNNDLYVILPTIKLVQKTRTAII